MDRDERLEAVRERVIALRNHAVEAREAGPPCWQCRFYELPTGRCKSDVIAGMTWNAEYRRFRYGRPTKATDARAPSGLCGPEALLFEKITKNPYLTAALIAAAGASIFGPIWLMF